MLKQLSPEIVKIIYLIMRKPDFEDEKKNKQQQQKRMNSIRCTCTQAFSAPLLFAKSESPITDLGGHAVGLNLIRVIRKPVFGFLTRSDTNRLYKHRRWQEP